MAAPRPLLVRASAATSATLAGASLRYPQRPALNRRAGCDMDILMNVVVDLCVVPVGVGVSLSPYIAACQKVLQARGLAHSLHAYGTNIEGDWDEVFSAIRTCHEEVHKMGAPRITTTIKLGTRTDRAQSMDDKVSSVQRLLSSDDPKDSL